MYGAINGYTTETYESLHKDFVKIPYWSSNKKKRGNSAPTNRKYLIICKMIHLKLTNIKKIFNR